jgi:PAS domain S-box-containing protein
MDEKLRKTGISIIGDIPWGAHFCQFYKTKKDLLDILCPYFKAGLEKNEFCMWITAEPLRAEEAVRAMKEAVPNFEKYFQKGQIEILPHTEWYLKGGKFSSKRVLNGWVKKVNQAVAKGYEGLRLTGNTFWLEKKDWKKFTDYEEEVNNVIGQYKMMAICTYSLDRCDANEIIDVVRNHQFALIKREGKWELIESSERKRADEALRKSETNYRIIAENTYDWEFWLNPEGKFLYVSPSCKRVSGYDAEDFLKNPDLRQQIVHPDDRPLFDSHLREVERKMPSGEIEFRIICPDGSQRWISHACQPIFDQDGVFLGTRGSNRDITEREQVEEALVRSNERFKLLSETAGQLLLTDAPQQIVNALCRKVLTYLDCDAFFNYLADDEKHQLHLNAYGGIPEETAREVEWLEYGTAVCGCAARDGCRIVAENIPETLDPRTDLVRSFGIKAYACHPLFSQGRVMGTLSFGTRTKLTFTEDELFIMKTMADQVAIAMERIQHVSELKKAQEALRRSRDELEIQVQERTSDLQKSNEELRAEVVERKRAEEKIREQADLLELTHDAIIVRDMNDRIVFWNRGAEETYGWTKEDAMGNVTHVFLQTQFPKPLAEITNDLLETGRWQGELVHSKRDGSHLIVETRQVLTRGKEGKPLGTLETNRDITKRKRAEEALRTASLYTRSLIEASLDPLVTISVDGKIMDVNRATELATGVSREKLIGSDFSDYFTEPERARAGYQKVFSEGSVTDYPLAIRHTSGRTTEVLYNATVYRNEAGEVQGAFAAARDITELKKSEEAVRAASLYTRSLIEASLDPLVTISVDGKIMDVNRATELVTGVPREQLIGSDFSDYFNEPEKAREGYHEVFSEGSVTDYPLAIRHTSGRTTDVLYNATVYRNEAGEVQGVFAAARDVTQLKRAEERLRTYMTKLEWSNRELQDFAFVASHDLQEPLRKIQAFGDQLKTKYKESLNDEGRDYLGRMQNAANRMQTLIQALLNYSRVTTKAEPFSPVNLTRLIQEVVNDLEMSIRETGGQVEVGKFPDLEADANQLRQLFQNLISNGLKFRQEAKPVIKIYGSPFRSPEPKGVSSAREEYQIFVEDNGIGFDEKYLDRIFVPFQRLHGRDTYKGTGIGLAICRKIVERHGGSITAKSAPGKGSTFIITLPMRQPKGGDA